MEEHLDVKVYYEDTDCLGLVYHANYLKYFERGRSELFERRVAPLGELNAAGEHYVVHEIKATFKAPARLGDALDVSTRPEVTSPYRLLFHQQARRAGDDALLVTAEVEVVCVDDTGALRELPPRIRDIMSSEAP